MSTWLKRGEAEYLKEDNEWYLVMLDISSLMENYTKFSDSKEYAARAISFVLSHIERNAPDTVPDTSTERKPDLSDASSGQLKEESKQ